MHDHKTQQTKRCVYSQTMQGEYYMEKRDDKGMNFSTIKKLYLHRSTLLLAMASDV